MPPLTPRLRLSVRRYGAMEYCCWRMPAAVPVAAPVALGRSREAEAGSGLTFTPSKAPPKDSRSSRFYRSQSLNFFQKRGPVGPWRLKARAARDEVLVAIHRPSAGVVGLVGGCRRWSASSASRWRPAAAAPSPCRCPNPHARLCQRGRRVGALRGAALHDNSYGNGANQTFAIEIATTAVVRTPPLPRAAY